jgi:hypothetical protein
MNWPLTTREGFIFVITKHIHVEFFLKVRQELHVVDVS